MFNVITDEGEILETFETRGDAVKYLDDLESEFMGNNLKTYRSYDENRLRIVGYTAQQIIKIEGSEVES